VAAELAHAAVIGPNSRVVVHIALSLPDGEEVLSTFDDNPLDFTLGDGTLQPGLELALFGLAAGAEEDLSLQPGLAYGYPDEQLIQWLPREQFADMAVAPDQVIGFSLPNGEETAGRVLELTPEQVRIDFNHPLAGLPLQLRVHVLEVAA
jgi:FKBP-type peptidyl-prolyl cis-trans isomerase SlpA